MPERERGGEERERDFKSQNVYRSNSSKTVISSLLLFFNCPVHFWFCSQKKAVCLPVSSLDTDCNSPNAFYLEYTSETSTRMLVWLWDSTLNSDCHFCYWLLSSLLIIILTIDDISIKLPSQVLRPLKVMSSTAKSKTQRYLVYYKIKQNSLSWHVRSWKHVYKCVLHY